MSGRIPREFIDDLLVRVDLVDLIDSHVPLKKTGSNFVARCPFHDEKTPSFSVNQKKQFFHCFGCGASGNAIGFLMDYNHLDFVEAVEDLAGFVGVDVPREQITGEVSRNQDDLTGVYDVMRRVAEFFVEQLKSGGDSADRAVQYLKARGVSGKVAKQYMLGFAPSSWDALASRDEQKELLVSGMLIKRDNGGFYDRFRNRIMFPIRDKRARIVGFGGRVLDDTLPKYLNSPETPIFSKSNEVYGLYELLERDSKPERILVVEGYFDVIALAQYGVQYAVATLGTATSKAHLELMFRFTTEVVLCFDGDKAGRQAAWRAMESVFPCLRDGRQVRIMLIPESNDPDSLIRAEGLEAFVRRIDAAQALSEYFFGRFKEDLELGSLEGRAQLVRQSSKYLESIPSGVFRDMMFAQLKKLSDYSKLDVSKNEAKLKPVDSVHKGFDRNRLSATGVLMALLLQNPGLAGIVEQKKITWAEMVFPGAKLFKEIMSLILERQPANASVLFEMFRGREEEKTVKALVFRDLLIPEEGLAAEFSDALERVLLQDRQCRIERLIAKEKNIGLSREERETLKIMLLAK